MKHILILGGTGHLGKILVQFFLQKNYLVTALVRNPSKLNLVGKNLNLVRGNVIRTEDLSRALKDIDIVISVLGHGFRTPFPIQETALQALLPLMKKKRVNRFITVTGAGLKVQGDPSSLIANVSEIFFSQVDPYRMTDAKNQQRLLEKSDLDWTVIRTPIHNNKDVIDVVCVGYAQPKPWQTISRKTICDFIVRCVEDCAYIKKSPIIFSNHHLVHEHP